MDYKYIEQLLERYWNCETSAEEEQILRIFFQQKEVPAYLRRYQSLFIYQEKAGNMKLGNDFEERILNEIERPVVKARHLSLYTRFQPLFKAAAVILLLLTIGGVVQHTSVNQSNGIVYVYDQFENHASDPQVAYESDSLKTIMHTRQPQTPSDNNHKR
ncbi:MAG TPA: hypothetical protein H9752_00110 [Candidatus Phocaeicola excrementigallinarum]|nr:hypothetical protein [Candidatus Phocaeicola excrementigallinarum]